MQFYDVVENRVSVKKYKNIPLKQDKLARMINAAMMSPSWKDKSSYKFLLVDDQLKKEELSKTVINDTTEASNAIAEAPMVAVVVADPASSGVVADRQYYLVDSAIAMEHFVLAATNEGYGTCWIASIDEDKIREILSIPNDYRVVAMTPIGEGTEIKGHNPKKNVNDYVFVNKWNTPFTNQGLRS
ncbi:nitroreductase family protein [Clostridiisalibacter paucivorans]|uniref:nitroreductase family protein n=1 Tax=Clostridiisalibacter paucivorans TaxID=408753 RepID=UPI00047C3064|nr:nitroreductase family protein [Clostridiisalibacter paucivorans]